MPYAPIVMENSSATPEEATAPSPQRRPSDDILRDQIDAFIYHYRAWADGYKKRDSGYGILHRRWAIRYLSAIPLQGAVTVDGHTYPWRTSDKGIEYLSPKRGWKKILWPFRAAIGEAVLDTCAAILRFHEAQFGHA